MSYSLFHYLRQALPFSHSFGSNRLILLLQKPYCYWFIRPDVLPLIVSLRIIHRSSGRTHFFLLSSSHTNSQIPLTVFVNKDNIFVYMVKIYLVNVLY
jgi:hypothetical protein